MLQGFKELRSLPRPIWWLSIAMLVNRVGTMVVPFLALYLTKQLGYSATQAGILLASYGVGSFLTAPIAGKMSDRFGARRMMVGSMLSTAVLFLVFPWVRGFPALLLATILLSILNEAFRPASMAVVGELTTKDQRKGAFALVRLAINLGMSIGPALGGLLSLFSFHWLFVIDSVTTLAAGIFLALVPWPKAESVSKPAEAGVSAVIAMPSALPAVWRDRLFLIFLVAMFPQIVIFFQHATALPLFVVNQLKLTNLDYGLLISINTGLILLFEVPLNHWTKHCSHRLILVISSVLWGVGFGALVLAHNFLTTAITVVIWTVGEMLSFPASSAYVAELAPPNRQGVYMGVYTALFGCGFVVGPALGTYLLEYHGSDTLWLTMLGLGMLSALLFSGLKR